MSICLRRCLAATALLLVLPAWAQQRLTLSEALRLATERSQQLVAADAAARAATEMAVAAGELSDPVFKAGLDNVPLSGPERFSLGKDFMTMQRIGVMQEWTRSEKRRLRVERVARDARRIEAERAQTLASLQRETALAWIDGRYTQAQLQVVQQQLQEARLQIEGAEIAFRTARGSQADVFAGQAGLAMLQDKLRQTERQAQAARLMLARWVGPQAGSVVPAGDVPWQRTRLAVSLERHLERHPMLRVLQAQIAAAETEVRQAEANRRPDVTLEAAYQRRGPGFPDMFSVGISLPLPISPANRQDREVAAKLANLEEVRAKYQDALAAEDAAVRVMLSDWESAKSRLARLQADLLPAAARRTEGALAAYRSGKGDLGAVLGARRDEIDARLQVLQLEMETARQWAQLEFLLPQDAANGEDPS
jgi:outer membrane protein TolC